MTQITKFEIGQTYYDRSACDYDCVFTGTVVSRTAKSVRIDLGAGRGVKTRRIAVWDGVETIKPYGSYSMCAIFSADRKYRG